MAIPSAGVAPRTAFHNFLPPASFEMVAPEMGPLVFAANFAVDKAPASPFKHFPATL
jgi:hypothetical protein